MEKLRKEKLDIQELRNRPQQELPLFRQEYAVWSLGLFGRLCFFNFFLHA
jgi:hypothetical protein